MTRFALAAVAVLAAVTALAGSAVHADAPTTTAPAPTSTLGFTMKDIDGKDQPLNQYAGKVIMIVNVASKCGNTPQYAALEKEYAKYKDKGFVILGFPANNFGHQEPGTDSQIKEFCTETYHVAFPMFDKISVKGDDQNALYAYLTKLDTKPQPKGDISWNFEKFIVGRDGNVVARFKPKTQPDDSAVVNTIETELAKAAQ